MKRFLIFTIFFYSVHAYISSKLEPLTDEIVKEINSFKISWKAGKNFGGSTDIDLSKLVCTKHESSHNDYAKVIHSWNVTNFPNSFDAREFWPECPSIGKIYDQRNGVPAWVYATIGQIADRLCIKHGVKIDVEATVKQIIMANGGLSSVNNSADFGQALNYWAEKGIFTAKPICLPFSECKTDKVKLDQFFKVNFENPRYYFDKMGDIMLNGPLSIQMRFYSDLFSYKSGIYERISGKLVGAQVIKLIGWGYEDDRVYWIATNSWGTQWGENGIFKLHRGSDQFGTDIYGLSASFQPIAHDNSKIEQDQLFILA